jgi:4-amino-4-deoxy-L-arabinose transferase-like glycosyltransferase
LLLLYLLHLGRVGFLGPDEPRYASIGREMARSGDWITPRLNGQPWFEKPPLTYWLTAAGNLAGLPDEWAARLPEALISAAFLIFFYVTLAREFTPRVALAATAILATSAAWLAYSFAALTDLPMSAALGAAMLIMLFDPRRAVLAGALLGFSILGKGFVPGVLIAPLFLIARGKRIVTLASAAIIAAPWFILCWLRNGNAFWDDFFWKQHVARFLTPSLEHVQPFWYYVPVLLAGLFPWIPLAGLLAQRRVYSDRRVILLAAWVLYGLIFFSVARNKLPGDLLPLFPAMAILLAVALETAPFKAWWLASCALLLVGLPTIAGILPDSLLAGLSGSHVAFAPGGLIFVGAAGLIWWLAWKQKTEAALLSVALAAGIGALYLKYSTFPELDRSVSVRSFWRARQSEVSAGCVDGVSRARQYGLNYYAGHEVVECAVADSQRPHITTRDRQLAMEDESVQKVVH